jgi:protein-S-isoprenylcysteine O-methyltransferase Ste14
MNPPPLAALAGYFAAYFGIAFVWRSWLVYRRTGTNPVVFPPGSGLHAYVGQAFRAVLAGCAAVAVAVAAAPSAVRWLGGYEALHLPAVAWAGWSLLTIALVWLLIAQAQMGIAWRIGIDERVRTPLVQRGLFGVSRNPIFLAMRVSLLGFVLVLPSAATLALLAAGEVLMQIQVRLEEEHLRVEHGVAFARYEAKVRRWL